MIYETWGSHTNILYIWKLWTFFQIDSTHMNTLICSCNRKLRVGTYLLSGTGCRKRKMLRMNEWIILRKIAEVVQVVRFQHSERLELELGLHIVSFLQLWKTCQIITAFHDGTLFGKGVLISHSRGKLICCVSA